jgi:hypothetical protein
LENIKADAQKVLLQAKRSAEKDALRKEPYFTEFETEIDKLAAMPAYRNVAIETIYELQLARAMRSGELEKIKQTAKKSAIADYTDKAKRSGVMTADNAPATEDYTSAMDDKAMKATLAFGNDPKKVSKYIFKEQKKKG